MRDVCHRGGTTSAALMVSALLILAACSTSSRAVATGTFEARIENKDGTVLAGPVAVDGIIGFDGRYVYYVVAGEPRGFDLRSRKRVDAELARNSVFPDGVPEPEPTVTNELDVTEEEFAEIRALLAARRSSLLDAPPVGESR